MDQDILTMLELIRLEGIVKMLWETIEHDDLADTVHLLCHNENENIRAELERMSRQQLIELASQHDDLITIETVKKYYEQYRYGLKPGFTIYLLTGSVTAFDVETFFHSFQEALNEIPDVDGAALRRIECKQYSQLADSIIELSMSYLKKHNYLDENEKPQFIYEYEEFFVWMNVEGNYMAIKNVPDKVVDTTLKCIREILHFGISYVKLTKSVIERAFGTEQRKGTYLKLNATDNEAEKIIISDERLQEKTSVLNSVSSYNMTSAYLLQTLSDDSINTLGINCEKGKLYLTKNVPASVFREWSIEAIQRIIPLITDYTNMEDFQTFKARNVIHCKSWGCTKPQAAIIEQIAYGVFESIRSGRQIAYINSDVSDIWRKTQSYWLPMFTSECPTCGEKTFISCPSCGSRSLTIAKTDKLICCICGEELDNVSCDEGHMFRIEDAYQTLSLLPTGKTWSLLCSIIHDELLLPMDCSFVITENHVALYPLHTISEVRVTDIPELKAIYDIDLTGEEYDALYNELSELNEKCKATRSDACNMCFGSDTNKCLMKIFTTFPDYRPSPHNGHEFGDIAFPVTYNGGRAKLVGAMKRALKSNLTRSTPFAREMFHQVFVLAQNSRIDIVAAVCPSRFQDQFREDLEYLSKLVNKPLIILDDLYMCRQLKAFKMMQSENLDRVKLTGEN